jgi:hypothetical protein
LIALVYRYLSWYCLLYTLGCSSGFSILTYTKKLNAWAIRT